MPGSFYVRPSRFLKFRVSRRGVRAGIGPRWLRGWLGAGGTGASTGASIFSYYQPLRRRNRRR
jgi:hypothetical protein